MIKNGIYNLAGTVVRLILSILSVPLLIKFLGAAPYGLYAILFAVVNFAVLTEWSISMILTVFLPAEIASPSKSSSVETLRVALLLVFCLSGMTTVALWVGAPFIKNIFDSLSISEQDTLQRGIRLSSIIVFTRLMQQYFVGIEQAYGKYKLLNSINTLYNITQTIAILGVAWWYKDILSIIIAQAAVSAVFVVLHAVACYRSLLLVGFRWTGPINWSAFGAVISYSFRTYIGAVGTALFSQGDRIVVGKLFGLEASGVYAALTGIVTQIHALSTIPVQPVMHTVSNLVTQEQASNNNDKSNQYSLTSVVSNALSLNATISVGLACFVIMMAPEITEFTFGKEQVTSVDVVFALRIVALIYSLYALNAVGYYILFAVKKEMVSIVTSLVCGSITLLTIYVAGREYGLIGAFIGNAGYGLTLFMLYKGLSSLNISWKLIYATMGLPVLVLASTIPIVLIASDFSARLLAAFTLGIVLLMPQFRNGVKLIASWQQSKSSLK